MGHAAYNKLHDKVQPERKPKDLTYEEIVTIVKKIYMPAENIFTSRIAFRKIVQNSGENLVEFEARLRKGCIDCQWSGDELQFNLMEQFIVGLEDKQLKQSVLLKSASKKKLEEIFDTATEIMSAGNTVASSSAAAPAIHYVLKRNSKTHKKPKPHQPDKFKLKPGVCYRCGEKDHMANNCKFKQIRCNGCGKLGHLQRVCTQTRQQNFLSEVPFHYVGDDTPVTVQVSIEGKSVCMEVDSGNRNLRYAVG